MWRGCGWSGSWVEGISTEPFLNPWVKLNSNAFSYLTICALALEAVKFNFEWLTNWGWGANKLLLLFSGVLLEIYFVDCIMQKRRKHKCRTVTFLAYFAVKTYTPLSHISYLQGALHGVYSVLWRRIVSRSSSICCPVPNHTVSLFYSYKVKCNT